jgi:hypothetical protein
MPGEPFKDLSLVLVECLLEADKDIVHAEILIMHLCASLIIPCTLQE